MEKIKIRLSGDTQDILEGALVICRKLHADITDNGLEIIAQSGSEQLYVKRDSGKIYVAFSKKAEFFRGLAIACDIIRNGGKDVVQKRHFDTCGVMVDCSRNAVINVKTVKEYLNYLALMGLDMIMLYTEDTYEIPEYPWFGYMRGRYTQAELREIDDYAYMLGIEVIPCIQTLGHLATTIRWRYAAKMSDTSDTLYIGAPETYEFIDKMFKSMSSCLRSRRIHIGLDEAIGIGTSGKMFKREGYKDAHELMLLHLEKVSEIAEKYGYKPMMWSDMFFKSGKIGGDYDLTSHIPDDTKDRLPKKLELVYWDYCFEDYDLTSTFIDKHQNTLARETVFAGGIWTWNRLCANNEKTFKTAHTQLKACKDHGIKTVFATIWNNTCAMYDLFETLPGLQMYAEQNYNYQVNDKQLSKMFEICTGYPLKSFMALSMDDFTDKEREGNVDEAAFCLNSSAQHMFNDVLIGLYDKTLSQFNFKTHYKKYLKDIEKVGDMGEFNDMFEKRRLLLELLVSKCDIGLRITDAYKEGKKDNLKKLSEELSELLEKYEKFHELSEEMWLKHNKVFGWEASDMMLSCIEARVKTAISRINDYLSGKIDNIEELEAERFFYNENPYPLTETNQYKSFMTVGNW